MAQAEEDPQLFQVQVDSGQQGFAIACVDRFDDQLQDIQAQIGHPLSKGEADILRKLFQTI